MFCCWHEYSQDLPFVFALFDQVGNDIDAIDVLVDRKSNRCAFAIVNRTCVAIVILVPRCSSFVCAQQLMHCLPFYSDMIPIQIEHQELISTAQ